MYSFKNFFNKGTWYCSAELSSNITNAGWQRLYPGYRGSIFVQREEVDTCCPSLFTSVVWTKALKVVRHETEMKRKLTGTAKPRVNCRVAWANLIRDQLIRRFFVFFYEIDSPAAFEDRDVVRFSIPRCEVNAGFQSVLVERLQDHSLRIHFYTLHNAKHMNSQWQGRHCDCVCRTASHPDCPPRSRGWLLASDTCLRSWSFCSETGKMMKQQADRWIRNAL